MAEISEVACPDKAPSKVVNSDVPLNIVSFNHVQADENLNPFMFVNDG